jgi:hypothetical protein
MRRHSAYRFLAIGLGIAVSMIVARSANSHGDAAWIMQNPSTAYCCGPNDCTRLPKDTVRAVTQGYLVTFGGAPVVVPFEKTLKSADDDFWACIPPGGAMKCFFAPPLGA